MSINNFSKNYVLILKMELFKTAAQLWLQLKRCQQEFSNGEQNLKSKNIHWTQL